MKECTMCEGRGFIEFEVEDYIVVSRDMASDACDPSLAGQEVYWGSHTEQQTCNECNGSGQMPENE